MKQIKNKEKLIKQVKDIRKRISKILSYKEEYQIHKELLVIEKQLGIKNKFHCKSAVK